ncbi:unnamed protein product, partial [Ectocarpus sp. 8 AP-2014]
GGGQGSHGGGGVSGGGGGTMLHCDPELAGVLGASSFPFNQLEEALGPHVEPAESPSLVATVSLEKGNAVETCADVTVDTETPFQLRAAQSLLGSDGGRGAGGSAEGAPLGRNGAVAVEQRA